MTLQEKEDMCSRVLIGWIIAEQRNKDMSIHDEDIKEIFTSKMILKKFEVFGIDIVLPDMLLLILNVCVNNNPGQFQVVLKDLLNVIKQGKGPIPSGYVIGTRDFVSAFNDKFPIMEIPEINNKYHKLWDDQKKKTTESGESDNLCDTEEWWKEVMM